jgi:hypothetical protein
MKRKFTFITRLSPRQPLYGGSQLINIQASSEPDRQQMHYDLGENLSWAEIVTKFQEFQLSIPEAPYNFELDTSDKTLIRIGFISKGFRPEVGAHVWVKQGTACDHAKVVSAGDDSTDRFEVEFVDGDFAGRTMAGITLDMLAPHRGE